MPLPKKLPLSSNQSKSDVPSKPKEVLANRYRVEKTLGKGNCGTALLVFDIKAKEERDKQKVVKKIFVGNLLADETVDAAAEANLLRSLDHPNIVKFYDSFVEGEFFCILTEYCDGGDLDTRITDYKKSKLTFPETQIVEWIIELLLALQYMHSRKILHRDLKTRNIFIRNELVKIGDFGISRILKGSADMASTFVGTPYYMSPEVLKHEGYNSKSDIWSIGCILYDLVALEHPFQGRTLMGVMYKITEEDPPSWPPSYSSELKDLFHHMLEKNPQKRLSASEALKLPFVTIHIEFLRNTIVVKHRSKDEKEVVSHETEAIASAFNHSAKLSELQKESEHKKFRNLPPRDRFRIEKQKKVDEELQRIKALTLQQAIETRANYEATRQAQNPYKSTIPLGDLPSAQRHREFGGAAALDYRRPRTVPGPSYQGHKSRSVSFDSEKEDEEDDEEEEEIEQRNERAKPLFRRSSADDDRPITPLKDRTVYNLKHNSLDFPDGIPEDKEEAETYYEQFADDFEEEEDDDDDDERAMVNNLQTVLDTNDRTLTDHTLVSDDKEAGPYGPAAKEAKIRKMRSLLIEKLGQDKFNEFYAYAKQMLYRSKPGKRESLGRELQVELKKIDGGMNIGSLIEELVFYEST